MPETKEMFYLRGTERHKSHNFIIIKPKLSDLSLVLSVFNFILSEFNFFLIYLFKD